MIVQQQVNLDFGPNDGDFWCEIGSVKFRIVARIVLVAVLPVVGEAIYVSGLYVCVCCKICHMFYHTIGHVQCLLVLILA